jgi:putative GTP pyrophosphokinase
MGIAAEEGPPVVTQRLKKLSTIAGKLLREPRMKLARMADIGGVRAVVADQATAFRIVQHLQKRWAIVDFHDYVTHPKADGYRGLHLISRHHDRLIEVQLRTPRQDRWANTVEILSRTAAPGLKFGDGPRALRDYFFLLGEVHAARDMGQTVSPVLLNRLQESAAEAIASMKSSR